MSAPLVLRAALKTYPHTLRIKSGAIADARVSLDCLDIDPIYRAFAPMARRQEYDVSEMAIVTYLQAKAYGKPLVMLPTVVAARLQQGCIVYNANHGPMTVADLAGKRVGVRAYSQTTGMWVRGILANTYGVPLDQVRWVAFEDSHLAEYSDPAIVTRARADQKMLAMLRAGELDAAIFGNDLPSGDGITPLIPHAEEADRQWYARHRLVPPNHVVVMRQDIAGQHPEAFRAVYDLLKRGKADAPATEPATRLPTGVDALRAPLQLTLDYCEQQGLLPRKLTLDAIFADSLAILGASGH
jgi:4,5-dihydroxyphthalate decarboxylase